MPPQALEPGQPMQHIHPPISNICSISPQPKVWKTNTAAVPTTMLPPVMKHMDYQVPGYLGSGPSTCVAPIFSSYMLSARSGLSYSLPSTLPLPPQLLRSLPNKLPGCEKSLQLLISGQQYENKPGTRQPAMVVLAGHKVPLTP